MDELSRAENLLLNLHQPEVFHCPILMMTEPGGAYFDEGEVANLRTYLLKGGFLWADDFWGEYAWSYWENQIRRVLPSGAYPIVTLARTCDLSSDVPPSKSFHRFRASATGTARTERGSGRMPMNRICARSTTTRPHHGVDDAQHRFWRLV